MVFQFVFHQMGTYSPLFGIQTCFSPEALSRLRPTKALLGLHLCEGSFDPLLIAYMISTLFSCAGSFLLQFYHACSDEKEQNTTNGVRLLVTA